MSDQIPPEAFSNHEGLPRRSVLELKPVGIGIRVLAFSFDYAMAMAVFMLLLTRLLLPIAHPGFLDAFNVFVESRSEMDPNRPFEEMMQEQLVFQETHEQAFSDSMFLYIVVIWLYFSLSDLFMRGSTLGKKIFKLQVICLKTLTPPGGTTILLRNCLKTLSITIIFPILLIINLIYPIFNRRRQAGHDAIAKTIVIHAQNAQQLNPTPSSDQI
jgi:uncharacterized RDD family membrane protein YckC